MCVLRSLLFAIVFDSITDNKVNCCEILSVSEALVSDVVNDVGNRGILKLLELVLADHFKLIINKISN